MIGKKTQMPHGGIKLILLATRKRCRFLIGGVICLRTLIGQCEDGMKGKMLEASDHSKGSR